MTMITFSDEADMDAVVMVLDRLSGFAFKVDGRELMLSSVGQNGSTDEYEVTGFAWNDETFDFTDWTVLPITSESVIVYC